MQYSIMKTEEQGRNEHSEYNKLMQIMYSKWIRERETLRESHHLRGSHTIFKSSHSQSALQSLYFQIHLILTVI